MGFKDAEWATKLDLPMMQKVTLMALSLRTDDKTHETFVGQQTIAEMIGASGDSVRRALRGLEDAGVITRERRHGRGGYRTSDLTRLNRTYTAERLEGSEPSGQTAYKADSRNLTGSQPQPNPQSAGAKEIIQIDHSVNHSERPRTRGSRLPDGWTPSPTVVTKMLAEQPNVDQEHELDKFTDYWAAQPGQKGVKTDWDATYRNWIRRAAEYAPRHKPTPTERARQTLAAGEALQQRRHGNITTFKKELSA